MKGTLRISSSKRSIMRSKYGSVKTTRAGNTFDSKLEATIYDLIQALRIPCKRQPEIVLQEAFKHDGKKIQDICYIADFLIEKDGKEIYIDAKGIRTDVFRIKEKLFKYKYPEKILLVVQSPRELMDSLKKICIIK